jgi:hypothetical protein
LTPCIKLATDLLSINQAKMTPQQKVVVFRGDTCASMRAEEARAPWLILLHGMAVIVAGLRKWLKLSGACEHCGRQF